MAEETTRRRHEGFAKVKIEILRWWWVPLEKILAGADADADADADFHRVDADADLDANCHPDAGPCLV